MAPRPRRELGTLEELERRRWHLWLVTAVVLVALTAAVVLLVSSREAATTLLDNPLLRYGFLAVPLVFVVYVLLQERNQRRVVRALLDQRQHADALESRVHDLTTLADAARTVTSTLSPEEVFGSLLAGAQELTGARTGSVLLRIRDEVRVVVSDGPHAVPRGTTLGLGDGDVGRAVRDGEPVVVDVSDQGMPGLVEPSPDGGSTIVAPLLVEGRAVGALAVARSSDDPPFDAADLETVVLFAAHAAASVSNVSRFERERNRVEQLVDAAEKRSEFVATLVHDMRSPLVAVQGYAGILRDRLDRMNAAQRSQAIDALLSQSERLQRMIEETLRTASTEAGAELKREPVDLAQLLTECRETVVQASAANAREGRDVRLHGLAETTLVHGDAEALRHVLVNLMENAVKYSPPGAPIEVRLERDEGEVRVHVTDQGPGIPSDEIGHVFERFRQAKQTGSGGVGLGLYIVRTLVQAHGGRVAVHSAPGEGTTFTVMLPAADREPTPLDV